MRLRSFTHAALAGLMLLAEPVVHAGEGDPANACKARSASLLDALVRADYVEASKGFASELATRLGADKLRQTWAAVQEQAGTYVSHAPAAAMKLNVSDLRQELVALEGQTNSHAEQVMALKLLINGPSAFVGTNLNFAKERRYMLVECDEQGRITRLGFGSPPHVGLMLQPAASHAMPVPASVSTAATGEQ